MRHDFGSNQTHFVVRRPRCPCVQVCCAVHLYLANLLSGTFPQQAKPSLQLSPLALQGSLCLDSE